MGSITTTCGRCGAQRQSVWEAHACCLRAPKSTGWCAWCGANVLRPRVFCDPRCAKEYFDDVETMVAAR